MSMQHVLLFLLLAVNSDQFGALTLAACSYALLPTCKLKLIPW